MVFVNKLNSHPFLRLRGNYAATMSMNVYLQPFIFHTLRFYNNVLEFLSLFSTFN